MRIPHLRALQALSAALAIAPFVALVACGPKSAPPSTSEPSRADGSASAPASAAASTTGAASAASASAVASATGADVVASAPSAPPSAGPSSASAPEDVGPPPRYAGRGLPCGAAVGSFIDAHRTCKTDGECAVTNTGCGMPGHCGVGVQAKAVGELQTKSRAAVAACQRAGVPLPCATCPQLPPARCAGGFCRP